MNHATRVKIGIGVVFALIVLIIPAAATLQANNAAKPMMSHDFTDVPVAGQEFMEPYIDAFYHQGITGGCSTSPLMYCPSNPVTRGSMAVFMGRALGYLDMANEGVKARAYFKQTGTGVTDRGIVVTAVGGAGVLSYSENGYGVMGESNTNSGVVGVSTEAYGVYGEGWSTYGVRAYSSEGTAMSADTAIEDTADAIYDLELGGTNGELFGSALNFFSNGDFMIDLDNNNNGTNVFRIHNGGNTNIFSVDETGLVTATALYLQTVTGYGANIWSEDNYGAAIGSTNASGIYAASGSDLITDDLYDIELGGPLGEIGADTLSLSSNSEVGIKLDNNNNEFSSFIVLNSVNVAVFGVDEAGDTFAIGSKSAIVDTVSYGTRAMYAVEATEVLFEDVGSAELVDGEAVITIDPMFAETVNLEEEYQVFLTPVGSPTLIYVVEKTATHVIVRSADGSDLRFDYRIVAKRLGYEDVRMEEVNP